MKVLAEVYYKTRVGRSSYDLGINWTRLDALQVHIVSADLSQNTQAIQGVKDKHTELLRMLAARRPARPRQSEGAPTTLLLAVVFEEDERLAEALRWAFGDFR
jgi:hypothetical protein